MIDMGDLREGIFFKNEDVIMDTVEEILNMSNIELYGVGVNLTCYGAIIPKTDNLGGLAAICAVCYVVFSITTLYYIGYPLLVAYYVFAISVRSRSHWPGGWQG
jgi:hypothetical protein